MLGDENMEFPGSYFIIILFGAVLLGITILFFAMGISEMWLIKKYKLKCNN